MQVCWLSVFTCVENGCRCVGCLCSRALKMELVMWQTDCTGNRSKRDGGGACPPGCVVYTCTCSVYSVCVCVCVRV